MTAAPATPGVLTPCPPSMEKALMSILRLYRSAVTVGREWRFDLARLRAPGLLLWGAADPYPGPERGGRPAKTTGARLVVFPGCSHWWPLERRPRWRRRSRCSGAACHDR